ncbi:hypothetical protein GIB67_041130 [Kingdonia uniflora]|uniref:Uncharacterized protein n=1 Tax=Kingdonia uniflora TaxID=39325 RepID=A0A7J7LKJ0_9MAGN|nr:hypothetical protein GIB67_041130 [Kingdonia uniflora]
MNNQVSSIPSPATIPSFEKPGKELDRPLVDFPPSVWGDYFLEYKCDDKIIDDYNKQVEGLKEEVRRMLIEAASTASEKMDLIDAVIRLGVGYHFEIEINKAIEELFNARVFNDNDDLHSVSLHFRLLRQHGYNASSDVFSKFKDDKGKFKSSLSADVPGMLSLYEATHLRVHDEDILDEALEFATYHLKNILATQVSSHLTREIGQALVQAYHKGMPRLETIRYIPLYEESEKRNEVLLKFAKLDYYLLRSLHLKELSEITEWWRNLDFATKLPYVRDRVVENYFWTLGVYFEPKYSFGRILTTKMTTIAVLLDDTYDAYGTVEELQLFTDVYKGSLWWDVSTIDHLPEYMQFAYRVISDFFDEIEKYLIKKRSSYRLHYSKETIKGVVRAYFAEAKWCKERYVPTTKEYLDVAMVSSNYITLTVASLLCLGDNVTKEAFDWLAEMPKILTASLVICRVMDDIKSHKFEQQRPHVASVVQCYTKEHGVSDDEACCELRKMVENVWKDINQAILKPTPVPMDVLMSSLNYSRVMDVIYKDLDGYTFAHLVIKDHVKLLLVDPPPM